MKTCLFENFTTCAGERDRPIIIAVGGGSPFTILE